jgi:hypothetical protein
MEGGMWIGAPSSRNVLEARCQGKTIVVADAVVEICYNVMVLL